MDWSPSALDSSRYPLTADFSALPFRADSIKGAVSESGLTLAASIDTAFAEVARLLIDRSYLLLGMVLPADGIDARVAEISAASRRAGFGMSAVVDRREAWAEAMAIRHSARLLRARQTRRIVDSRVAESIMQVARAMLAPGTGVIATHTRQELLLRLSKTATQVGA